MLGSHKSRAVAALTVLMALTLAVPANALLVEHTGYFSNEPFRTRVHFVVRVEHHKPTLVRAFTVHNLPYSCTDGKEGEVDVPRLPRVAVRQHRFKLTERSGKSTEKISGRVFGRGRSVAIGATSYSFERSDGTACTTGERRWVGANPEVIR